MTHAPETPPRKRLSHAEGVRAACILFELNTRESDILEMAERAGVAPGALAPDGGGRPADRAVLLEEWRGFVHAAVTYGLMAEAPNAVVADYLRATRELLGRLGHAAERIDAFIDDTFAAYIRLMAQNRQKECPARFYARVLGVEDLSSLPSERTAFLAGMMAITLCAVLDKFANYEFSAD